MGGPWSVLSPIGAVGFALVDVCLILAVARLVGGLFVWARQPRVVGEIVAGILLGPTVLGGALVEELFPPSSLVFLGIAGQIGLVLYMFLVGLELDRRLLSGRGKDIAVVALAAVAVPVGFGFLAGGYYDTALWRPDGVAPLTLSLFLGAGLSVTAFPVMARILQEKGLLGSSMGAVGVGAAAVVTVLMFLVITAASSAAQGVSLASAIAVRVTLLGLLLAGLHVLVRPVLARLIGPWEAGEPLGRILPALLVGALATALVTHWIGVHALVGAFLFGATLPPRDGLADAVIARLGDSVLLFFLPIFLAVSGLSTDLRTVSAELVPGLLLFLVLSIAGKWGAGFFAARLTGMASGPAHTLGVLLNCRGLLILVVALIGLELGVITQATQGVFVVAAIVTTLMTGPLVDRFLAPSS